MRVKLLVTIAKRFEAIQLDSAINALKKVAAIAKAGLSRSDASSAENNFFNVNLCSCYNALGIISKKKGKITEAIKYYEESIKIGEGSSNKNGLVESLNNIGLAYDVQGEKNKVLEVFERALKISTEAGDLKGEASSLNSLGYYYSTNGNTLKAVGYYEKSLEVKKQIGDKEGIATTFNNLARIFEDKGDIKKALGYYAQCLTMFEQIGDKKGTAVVLINMGVTFKDQGDYTKSLEYWGRSLKLMEETGEKGIVASIINNIGYVYYNFGDPSVKTSRAESMKAGVTKALIEYDKSLKIRKEIGDKNGIAVTLNNIAGIYRDKGDPSITSSPEESLRIGIQKALLYFTESYKLLEEIGNKRFMSSCLNNIGGIYLRQKDYSKALQYAQKSVVLAREMGFPQNIREAAKQQYDIYKIIGDQKKALEMYELYIQMRDSINNESTRKASIKSQLKYEYEKQAAADSVAHAKESEIKNVELRRQSAEIRAKKNQQYALFGGLGLVMIFAGFMYNRFKVTQKQKAVIEHQKEIVEEQKKLVEEKQLEILDSIKYARRIQLAQIPTEKRIAQMLKKTQSHEA